MEKELEELLAQLVEWPSEVQQKVIDTITAVRAEYIDCNATTNRTRKARPRTNIVRHLLYGPTEPFPVQHLHIFRLANRPLTPVCFAFRSCDILASYGRREH